MTTSGKDKTKELTCYYWHHYGRCRYDDDVCGYAHERKGRIADQPVVREPGRPAVAGANARRSQPIYFDWQLERQKRAIPPEIAAQIRAIHEKQTANQSTPTAAPMPASAYGPSSSFFSAPAAAYFPARSAFQPASPAYMQPFPVFATPYMAPMPVFYPPPVTPVHQSTPIRPLTSSPRPFIPAAASQQRADATTTPTSPQGLLHPATPPPEPLSLNSSPASPPRTVRPPIAPPARISPAQAVHEFTEHLHYAHVEMVEQCAEAMKALMVFEEGYVKKEGFAIGALTPAERFRVAMGRILDVCEGHLALLEAHKEM